MIFGLGLLVGAVAMALLFLAFLLPELRAERDEARREIKVYRNLLIPAMRSIDPVTAPVTARAEGAAAEPQTATAAHTVPSTGPRPAASSKPASPVVPKTAEDIWKMPIRYRDKFKLLMRLTNSKQVRTDTLASALSKQKPYQEK